MISWQAATKSLKRSGGTKYSCRMSVRPLSRPARLATGSFISVLRVAMPDATLGTARVSASQRARLAASEPIWAR